MFPETKFKVEKRPFSSYQNLNNLYNSFDNYFNNRSNPSINDMSRSNSNNSQEKKNYEYHEKFNGNMITESSFNKTTTNYGNLTKKPFTQRKTLQNIPTTPKNGYINQSPIKIRTNDNAKPRSSVSAYNLIPKSLLNDEPKKLTSPTKEVKTSNAQNISANKRTSVGQFPNSKQAFNKRSSVNYDNKRASVNYDNKRTSVNYDNKRTSVNYDNKRTSVNYDSKKRSTKSKSDNHIQKPKFGVIGVISANKSLNEFSKRSSRVLNQQTEEINNLKARIQELTADQDALRKMNEASTEDTLLEFNDKYLAPLLNKMSTYLMKFSSEYNEMIKSNSDFIESQHDRTEYLVELAANLNNQLNNFIEDFECDVFDERTYNKKRNQVDIIADTTSRLNSQLARVVLQLDDFRDSPDFQKDNMTNSIQSLGVILQQLNKAAIAVNEKIVEYENCIQQKDELFIRDQNSKDLEIDSLKHKVRNLNIALEQKDIEIKIKELINNDKTNDVDKAQEQAQEQKIHDLTEHAARLNTQLANLTLLFDSEISLKNKIIKEKESQIEKLRNTSSQLNHNLSVLTLLTNEKDMSNKRNIDNLMETISTLQTKWAAINSNLLTLTYTFNEQLKSKNEEIRLNRQDVVYFRNYTYELNNQMMNYLKDFFQRIWNKNHENELLLEKNRELINYCSNLNSRVARFTLEVNDLQNENNLLINKLASVTEPVATREISFISEAPISVNADKVEYYKNMAVNLNNRVAMLSLDIDALKLNKFNNEPVFMERDIPSGDNEEVIYTKIIEDESTIDFYRNQAVSLNSNLVKLTLEYNDFKNQELQNKNNLIKNYEEKIEYYQQMAANLNTKLALLSLEMNDVNKPINNEITENEKLEYYQNLVTSMNSKINYLIRENEELKVQQTRSIPQEPQAVIQVVNNTDFIQKIKSQIVDLNQRLSVLTLSSNDEINLLKKQLAQKEHEVDQYRNKLASMNRQIIDLTFYSNLERQQYTATTNIDVVQSREINVNENSNYEAIISEKDLIIKQLQEQLTQMNIQNNNSAALMAELENEKRKNQELNQTINNMRNEAQSISNYIKETTSLMQGLNNVSNPAVNEEIASITEYLKETKRCLEDYKKANTQEMTTSSNNVSVNEEIVSLAEYLKETKRCLEDFRNSNTQEINSISEYLKDTIKMAKEYNSNF